MRFWDKPAIDDPRELVFGRALHPVTMRRGMEIGGGIVYPELNFTLPIMEINESTLPEIRDQYRRIVVEAAARAARTLRDWLVRSDARLDPQAYVLTPENAVRLARAITRAEGYYEAGKAAARCAVDLLDEAMREGRVRILDRERPWLDRMRRSLDSLPDDEDEFIARRMAASDRTKFLPAEYGIELG